MAIDVQIQLARHTSFEVYRYQLVVNKNLKFSIDEHLRKENDWDALNDAFNEILI